MMLTKSVVRAAFACLATLCAQAADPYYLAFLRPNPDRKPLAKEEGERIQAAHMANIRGMAARGVLVGAGPFGDTPATISGIFVFKTGSLEEARRITAEDPTVKERRNNIDVLTWMGPEGIGEEYKRLHAADPSTPEDMGVHPFCLLRRGPKWNDARRGETLKAHEAYLERLRKSAKLAAAGEVRDGGDIESIVVLNRIPDDEARQLMEADPAVQRGDLRLEYHRWWSAAHVLPGR